MRPFYQHKDFPLYTQLVSSRFARTNLLEDQRLANVVIRVRTLENLKVRVLILEHVSMQEKSFICTYVSP